VRVLLGVGESVSTAASLRWIRFNCQEAERGLATGILFSGTKFGAAAGVPVAAFLIARYGWRLMFLILGLGGLFWLIVWFRLVQPDNHAPRAVEVPGNPSTTSVWEMLKTSTMWGVILGTFAYNYFIYFCLTWLPAYLMEARHLSLNSMSIYTMFSFGGIAIVGILAGWLSDSLIRRGRDPIRIRKIFTILGFIAASTEIFGGISDSRSVAIFFALFSLSGLGLATANYWALTQTLIPKNAIGRAVGLQNFASNCSGIVAPIVTGGLKQLTGSYAAPMLAVLIVLLIGVGSYGVLVKQPACDRDGVTV
jgi:MFS family permease